MAAVIVTDLTAVSWQHISVIYLRPCPLYLSIESLHSNARLCHNPVLQLHEAHLFYAACLSFILITRAAVISLFFGLQF